MIINMMKLPVRDLIQGYSEDDATSMLNTTSAITNQKMLIRAQEKC